METKLIHNFYNKAQNFITGHTRHLFARESMLNDVPQRPNERIDSKTQRIKQKRNGKPALKINESVTKISNKTNLLLSGSKAGRVLQKIAGNKWARRGAFALGASFVFNLAGKAMSGFTPSPAIPKEYERGYDLITESMTDFGSPVNLSKTASKTITPYYSTIRKGFHTSVRTTTERNPALFASKHAINHTKY